MSPWRWPDATSRGGKNWQTYKCVWHGVLKLTLYCRSGSIPKSPKKSEIEVENERGTQEGEQGQRKRPGDLRDR